MDPADFHKTAEFLKGQPEEWHLRTSINRSYYGLFLHLRKFLSDGGIRLPDRSRKSHHQFVIDCFRESRFLTVADKYKGPGPKKSGRSKDNLIGGIYLRLKSLLQNRTNADYNLNVKFRQKDSEDNFLLATRTIQDFDGLLGSDREEHIINTARAQLRLYQ